jgi:membrane fusion protein (multidrug efflux system)
MIKRMVFMLIAVAVLFGVVFGFEAFRNAMVKKFMASLGAPVQVVAAMPASAEAWLPKMSAVGSLRAINGTNLSCEVDGIVDVIHFTSGEDVQQGQMLISLRNGDDVAKLHGLQATADLAKLTLQRDQQQLRAQAVSQATIDLDAATLKNLLAQVDEQAAILQKKSVRAPFAGRVGIRQVDLGQYVSPGMPIVALQALDALYVDFPVPQQAIGRIHLNAKITIDVDTQTGSAHDGVITAINSLVDEVTRNVQVRGTVPNPDGRLLPGMFANVTIDVGKPQTFVTVPQTAVSYSTFGDTVFVLEEQGKDATGKPLYLAHQELVNLGESRGDQVQILHGVKAGDLVVVAGQLKLHDKASATLNNHVLPSNDPHPTPSEP